MRQSTVPFSSPQPLGTGWLAATARLLDPGSNTPTFPLRTPRVWFDRRLGPRHACGQLAAGIGADLASIFILLHAVTSTQRICHISPVLHRKRVITRTQRMLYAISLALIIRCDLQGRGCRASVTQKVPRAVHVEEQYMTATLLTFLSRVGAAIPIYCGPTNTGVLPLSRHKALYPAELGKHPAEPHGLGGSSGLTSRPSLFLLHPPGLQRRLPDRLQSRLSTSTSLPQYALFPRAPRSCSGILGQGEVGWPHAAAIHAGGSVCIASSAAVLAVHINRDTQGPQLRKVASDYRPLSPTGVECE